MSGRLTRVAQGAKVPVSSLVNTVLAYNDLLVWGPTLMSFASLSALPPSVAEALRVGGVTAIFGGAFRAAVGTQTLLDASNLGLADQPAHLRFTMLAPEGTPDVNMVRPPLPPPSPRGAPTLAFDGFYARGRRR